jgi:hypothetical protein
MVNAEQEPRADRLPDESHGLAGAVADPAVSGPSGASSTDLSQPSDAEMPDPIEVLTARMNSMREWAAQTQSQIKGMASGLQVLDERTSQIGTLQECLDAIASQVAEFHHSDPRDVVDGAIGYHPTPEQQAQLFAALAEWQQGAATLDKGQVASIKTRAGDEVSYRYADIASASVIARSAGAVGLSHFHREIVIHGQSFIRTYLLHKAGGWVSCDVPLLVKENTLISSLQQWASACTMARRYGLFMVFGIAAAEDDDDGASAGQRARNGAAPAGATQGAGPRQSPRPATATR